jgi:bacteriocin-like protein
MTTPLENKDKAEPKISNDELSEKELEKISGGAGGQTTMSEIQVQKVIDKSSPVVPFEINISPPFRI